MALTGFNYNVRWKQFREISKQPKNVTEDAEILVNYSLAYSTNAPANQECQTTTVTIGLKVNKGKSWVVKDKKTAELLRHEQGHYDITALGVREVYQRILALSEAQCSDVDSESRKIQVEVQSHINQVNTRYDTRTSHGAKSTVQKRWETSIRTAKQKAKGTLADLP